jgi:hypothetical protein
MLQIFLCDVAMPLNVTLQYKSVTEFDLHHINATEFYSQVQGNDAVEFESKV